MQSCPSCKRQVVGRAGACDHCGHVLVALVDCKGCGRKLATIFPKCQFCGTAMDDAEPAKSKRSAGKPSPTLKSTGVTRHFIYTAISLGFCGAFSMWTPEAGDIRLLLYFVGPVLYLLMLALHYRTYADSECSLMVACEGSNELHWAVVASCFAAALAALYVVRSHLGWQTAAVLVSSVAATAYFGWFGYRLIAVRRR